MLNRKNTAIPNGWATKKNKFNNYFLILGFLLIFKFTANFSKRSVAKPMSIFENGIRELRTEGIIHC